VGHKSILSEDQEHQQAQRIILFVKVGFSMAGKEICGCVVNLMREKHCNSSSVKTVDWLESFLHGNEDIRLRNAQPVLPGRE
jgi:hypothetical protein